MEQQRMNIFHLKPMLKWIPTALDIFKQRKHLTLTVVKKRRFTLYIGAFTVTIIVKKRENRHSAK